MDKQEKKFIGVWIEAYVWNSRAINLIEKALLTEIIIFNKGDKGCFANNKHFAEMFDLSEDRISKLLTGLRRKGLININLQRKDSFKVTRRTITVNDVEKVLEQLPDIVRKVRDGKNTYVDEVGKNDSDQVGKNDSDQVGKNTEYINITSNTNITKDINIKDMSTSSPAVQGKYENDINEIVNHLNLSTGVKNRPQTKSTVKLLTKILKEGYTVDNCKDVINFKTHEWINNAKMRGNLVPGTLFAFANFEKYMDQLMLANQPVNNQKKYQAPQQQVLSKQFVYDESESY